MNVSILIATYGEQDWYELALSRAFPSAMAQGDFDVRLRHQPDGSIATARNSLGEESVEDWLCFLDADDELAPGYLDAMKRALERAGDDGTPRLLTPAVSYVRNGRPRPPQFNDRGIPLTDDNWLVVGTLVQRDLFLKVGGFSDYEHGFEDFALWSKCWRAGAEIIKVPDAIYIAHVNPNSKHRRRWRDRPNQVAMHQQVVRELDEWEASFKHEASYMHRHA